MAREPETSPPTDHPVVPGASGRQLISAGSLFRLLLHLCAPGQPLLWLLLLLRSLPVSEVLG